MCREIHIRHNNIVQSLWVDRCALIDVHTITSAHMVKTMRTGLSGRACDECALARFWRHLNYLRCWRMGGCCAAFVTLWSCLLLTILIVINRRSKSQLIRNTHALDMGLPDVVFLMYTCVTSFCSGRWIHFTVCGQKGYSNLWTFCNVHFGFSWSIIINSCLVTQTFKQNFWGSFEYACC